MGGLLLDDETWRRAAGVWRTDHGRTSTWYGRLSFGTPVLNAGVGVDRSKQETLSAATPSTVTESYTAFANWHPSGLPELDLRLSRINAFDMARASQDVTTDSAHASLRYATPRYDLRYLLAWGRQSDWLHAAETSTVEQNVLATRNDTFFEGRMTTYLSASLQTRTTAVVAHGEGATVARQQVPTTGYSAVVAAPATTADVALTANPAVVDGNTSVSASANVGFGPYAAGDSNPREVGAGFADAVTAVNRIHVWHDRALPAAVSDALARSIRVYRSADNQHWTPVNVVGVPAESPFERRIEVEIEQTEARFLKVSLTPVAPTVTSDAAFREIYVTELQFFLVLSTSAVPRRQTGLVATGTALVRTVLARSVGLAHDLSATVTRQTETARTTYSVVNGLSASREVRARLTASARVAREDSDVGVGHEGGFNWSAALVGRPLPTALWSLTYSGSDRSGFGTLHALTALGRADWYDGIATNASASASQSTQGLRWTRSLQATSTTSLKPNAVVTLSVGGLYTYTLSHDPDFEVDLWSQFARVDGTLSLTPAPALSATGTVSRIVIGERPTTLASVQLAFSPLMGELQLAATYSKTLDVEADATLEMLVPSLRWNVRRGVLLTATYTLLHDHSPARDFSSRVANLSLLVSL